MVRYIETGLDYYEAIAILKTWDYIGVDTETTGIDPYTCSLLLIQMGNEVDQYVFDYQRLKKCGIDFSEMKLILASQSIKKLFHNAKFDYKILKYHLGVRTEKIICTFVLEHLLKKGIRQKGFGLADVAKRYANADLEKSTRQTFGDHKLGQAFTEEQIQYSADDVKFLIPIFKKQSEQIRKWCISDLAELECNVIQATGDMELNGIYLDSDKWRALFELSEKSRAAAKAELMLAFGGTVAKFQNELRAKSVEKAKDSIAKKVAKEAAKNQTSLGFFDDLAQSVDDLAELSVGPASEFEVNLSSSLQMQRLLSIHLGIVVTTTEEEQLKKISKDPIIEKVIAFRKAEKLCTTYGEAFLKKAVHPVTGRIHTNFNQTRADSGRYSSSDPVNLQNIPNKKEYRAAFTVQDPDWRMICADYSGCELRLIAEICNEPKWIDAFRKGYDMHSYVASMLFNKPYHELVDSNHKVKDEYKAFRSKAKNINFGVAYGMKAGRLAHNLGVPFEEAKQLLEAFWNAFPAIASTLKSLAENAIIREYAISPLDGRRRYLKTFDFSVSGERAHAENIAKNLPFQGRRTCNTALFVL